MHDLDKGGDQDVVHGGGPGDGSSQDTPDLRLARLRDQIVEYPPDVYLLSHSQGWEAYQKQYASNCIFWRAYDDLGTKVVIFVWTIFKSFFSQHWF